jgi:2-oxo-hept-3-ene-1,7-dioate hydratase
VAQQQQAAGAKLIGYKVGLTSLAMRRSSKIDEPDYGFLFDYMLIEDGAKVPHANYCVPDFRSIPENGRGTRTGIVSNHRG